MEPSKINQWARIVGELRDRVDATVRVAVAARERAERTLEETRSASSEERNLLCRQVSMLKEEPRNAFRKISYAIYETPYNDFGFCVAHTNVVQNNQKTLDKLEQE